MKGIDDIEKIDVKKILEISPWNKQIMIISKILTKTDVGSGNGHLAAILIPEM